MSRDLGREAYRRSVSKPENIHPFNVPRRTKNVQLVLAEADWAELSRQAAQEGLSRAGLIRRTLRAAKVIRPLSKAEAAT